jgi:hypothetical protein
VLVLCLAVQVTVAPWLPCPCQSEERATRHAVVLDGEEPHEDEAPCGRCEAGNNVRHCQKSSSTISHAESWVSTVQKTRLPDGHTVALGVVFDGTSPPSPDVHRLQVLLE